MGKNNDDEEPKSPEVRHLTEIKSNMDILGSRRRSSTAQQQ